MQCVIFVLPVLSLNTSIFSSDVPVNVNVNALEPFLAMLAHPSKIVVLKFDVPFEIQLLQENSSTGCALKLGLVKGDLYRTGMLLSFVLS